MKIDFRKENDYWNKYWAEHSVPFAPSLFAKFVLQHLPPQAMLCELGCGNGRDAVYFSMNNICVDAYDLACNEIEYLQKKYASTNLQFFVGDFSKLFSVEEKYNAIYSRFTIHSVTEEQEDAVLAWAYTALKKGGCVFFESRSIKDPLLQTGEKLSSNENFTDHYRRYMDAEKFQKKLLKLGFDIVYREESDLFAPYGDEKPMIVRIIAKKMK